MGLVYEEFRVGQEFPTESVVVTRQGIAAFAELTGDDNPLHTDVAYARASGFPDVLAHGPYVQSLAIGLSARTRIMTGTTLALLSASASFRRAVFPGDELRALIRISRKRPTRSPARGIVWRRIDVTNQADEVVAQLAMTALVRRRNAAEDSVGSLG
jgi:acyl dehydratase